MDQDELSQQRVDREVNKQGKKIKRNFSIIIFLAYTTILIPTILLLLNCRLALELNYGQWFARSGSIVVMLSIIADFLIFSNYELMKPVPEDKGIRWESFLVWQKLALHYYDKNKRWGYIFIFPTVVGTIIWGYGDLIWNFFH